MSKPNNAKPFFSTALVRKAGIFLVVLSFFLYGAIFLIPFAPYDVAIKTKTATILFILREITFWGGAIILGKEFISKYKNNMNPVSWFRKKTDMEEKY